MYVCDTAVWIHGRKKLDCFRGTSKVSHPNMRFTIETEKDSMLPSGDVLEKKLSDGSMTHAA
jgi:hypothetical protein